MKPKVPISHHKERGPQSAYQVLNNVIMILLIVHQLEELITHGRAFSIQCLMLFFNNPKIKKKEIGERIKKDIKSPFS